ncbi:hypothetical protein BD324DRAFT_614868 [Kockovaella imperatae]|uniref:2'-5' RNA ligase superfamily-domain-containing protein n=1 Tax=Kockovaella imperatae TaxID=4999 RepID=A0A1Y1UQN8_9TREE|nr:hypothetical protein BD324DRAFT_614868 [Kockovaella imperatae]ORX39756.1 hypothetical protein BD324DRAFT_614868 [Kockovaella imperatae]
MDHKSLKSSDVILDLVVHTMSRPLVLTLKLDKGSTELLTSLRANYFPKHRNHLNAHLTLFHAIPPDRRGELDRLLQDICKHQKEFNISIARPSRMGKKGVMLHIRESGSRGVIEGIHSSIVRDLSKVEKGPPPGSKQYAEAAERGGRRGSASPLTDQDLEPLRSPHVTILNKAEDEGQVEDCHRDLVDLFNKMDGRQKHGTAIGLQLWEYNHGPWIHLHDYSFVSH